MNCIDLPSAFNNGAEYLELGMFKQRCDVSDLIAEAKIRFIRTVALHAFLPGQTFKCRELNVLEFRENRTHQLFNDRKDIVLFHKAHLDINLCEFRLTVSTKVFITEAAGNLEIAFHACNHKQLLIDLRTLRQCPEPAVVNTGRNQIVTCAFRCGTGKDRCGNFHESFLIQNPAGNHLNLVTQDQVILKRFAAKIEIPVLQTDVFTGIGVIRNRDR